MRAIYFFLSLLGLVIPYSKFIAFIADRGFNLALFWKQLFINQISSFFALDLLISMVVFWIFLIKEGTRLQMKFLWIYIVLNLIIGLSFALPLFLGMRSLRLAEPQIQIISEQA